MKRQQGFTLAEVLITITIIGVISALTLPGIQANTAANRNRAALKNTMSILSQIAQSNMATQGWNFSNITDICSTTADARAHSVENDNYSICAMMNSNLTGETNLGIIGQGRPDGNTYRYVNTIAPSGNYVGYLLSNGAIVGLETSLSGNNCQENNNNNCHGFIDVNGLAGPHREITCQNGNIARLWPNGDRTSTCTIERNTNADIFPIKYHGSTIELASDAARSFLNAR